MSYYTDIQALFKEFEENNDIFLKKGLIVLSYNKSEIVICFNAIADKTAIAQTTNNENNVFIFLKKKYFIKYHFLKKVYKKELLNEVMLHELVHAVQHIKNKYELNQFYFLEDYWEIPQEVEAYTLVLLQRIKKEKYNEAIKYLEVEYPEFAKKLNFKKFLKKAEKWGVPTKRLNEFIKYYREYLSVAEQ